MEDFNFENSEQMNAVFAFNIPGNIKLTEKALSVLLHARGLTVRIESEETTEINKVRGFFVRLVEIYRTQKSILDQNEFERILNAFRKGNQDDLNRFFQSKIKVSEGKKGIIPRNHAQLSYIESIKDNDIVFGTGPAGTGKTYIAMAMAVSSLLKGDYNRIILTRPALEAGENLGFLPGNLEEKITPYLRPLYDALYEMLEFGEAQILIEKNIVELAPLAFMRGRTLNNAFVILDEAQNATKDQMLMFLTRMGFNSKCVITGDPSQNDLGGRADSGLIHSVKILSEIQEISLCRFGARDVVRHPLVEKVINAYMEANKRRD